MEIRLKLDLMSGIWKQRRKNGGHSGLGNHMIKDKDVEMKGLRERRDCQKKKDTHLSGAQSTRWLNRPQ